MIQPLLNTVDDEWVTMVGRYILNMGAVEMATRVLVAAIEGDDRSEVMTADLPSRLGFVRKRFPRTDLERHAWAMNVFTVTGKHIGFRNAIAHSPIVITGHEDGTRKIQGILNITPNEDSSLGHLISIEELKSRVNESASIGSSLLEMQKDFSGVVGA